MLGTKTWQVHMTGRPEAIRRGLDAFSESLNGDGKADFLRVKPTLMELLNLNEHMKTEISFAASGDKDHVALFLMSSPSTHVE